MGSRFISQDLYETLIPLLYIHFFEYKNEQTITKDRRQKTMNILQLICGKRTLHSHNILNAATNVTNTSQLRNNKEFLHKDRIQAHSVKSEISEISREYIFIFLYFKLLARNNWTINF